MNGRTTAMLILGALLGAQVPALAATPQPVATNKTRFRIPFKIDPAALQRLNARELQLHVSKDGGVTWEQTQALPPDGAKFEYQADGDGEYRFAVKTLDGRNQVHPPVGQYETGLIVQVDTLAPLLELTVQQSSPGKVQLTWNAADAHLDTSTLKLEYLQPGSQDWEPVEVSPKATGQIIWNVAQQGQVKVRGTIADTASNIGRGQAQVQVIAVGDPPPKPRPGRRVPIAGLDGNQEQTSTGTPREATRTPIASSIPETRSTPEPILQPEDRGDFRGPVIRPFGSGAESPPAAPSERLVTGNATSRPEITRGRWDNEPEEPAMAHAIPNPMPNPPARAAGAHRIVSSRRFQVGYTIDDVGPSGIGAVELFITQDQGRKWWKYGDDPDRRSPFDVEVPQDGDYGFSIRVRSGVGLTNDPPVPGEAPAIIVAVDQTPPTVELLSAQQGKGSLSNRIQVRWRIADEHLAAKPIAIYYSANRAGPWEPVCGWTDDRGTYEWTVSAGSPSQFYVRVVARDVAGNTGKADSAQPIMVDLARPTARIVDVEAPQTLAPQ